MGSNIRSVLDSGERYAVYQPMALGRFDPAFRAVELGDQFGDKLFHPERLVADRPMRPVRRNRVAPIARDQQEWDRSRLQRLRHGIDFQPVEIHVQHGHVDRFMLGRLVRAHQPVERPDDNAAMQRQYLFDQEGNHHFILNEENAETRQRRVRAHN
jgi:hypothetical protein